MNIFSIPESSFNVRGRETGKESNGTKTIRNGGGTQGEFTCPVSKLFTKTYTNRLSPHNSINFYSIFLHQFSQLICFLIVGGGHLTSTRRNSGH